MAFEVFQTSLLKNQPNNWMQVMIKPCKVFQTSLLENQANQWSQLMEKEREVFQTSVLGNFSKAMDAAGGR